jgi:hypothetical protein
MRRRLVIGTGAILENSSSVPNDISVACDHARQSYPPLLAIRTAAGHCNALCRRFRRRFRTAPLK